MDAIEEAAQAFKHSPEEMEKLEKSYFCGELLMNGKKLIAGKAIFEFDRLGRGMFIPDKEFSHEGKLHEAAILRSSEGREFILRDFELCRTADSLHYHFSCDVVSEK